MLDPLVQTNLPTMYDLPSEEVGEPGLPDEFHCLQGPLLSLTFRPPAWPDLQVFSACDLYLYYDLAIPCGTNDRIGLGLWEYLVFMKANICVRAM